MFARLQQKQQELEKMKRAIAELQSFEEPQVGPQMRPMHLSALRTSLTQLQHTLFAGRTGRRSSAPASSGASAGLRLPDGWL